MFKDHIILTFFTSFSKLYSVIPVFKSAAEELLSSSGLTPVELLAKALAKSIVSFALFFFSFHVMCYMFCGK